MRSKITSFGHGRLGIQPYLARLHVPCGTIDLDSSKAGCLKILEMQLVSAHRSWERPNLSMGIIHLQRPEGLVPAPLTLSRAPVIPSHPRLFLQTTLVQVYLPTHLPDRSTLCLAPPSLPHLKLALVRAGTTMQIPDLPICQSAVVGIQMHGTRKALLSRLQLAADLDKENTADNS